MTKTAANRPKDMQTQITIDDGRIHIRGPYSDSNNATWRSLGGKFSGGAWEIPDNETTRGKIAEMFGAKADIITALVPGDKIPRSYSSIEQIGGYVLAQRRSRDSAVQMPNGVSLHAGIFRPRGGSVKNPSVALDSDVVFALQCRRSFAEVNGLEISTQKAASLIEI